MIPITNPSSTFVDIPRHLDFGSNPTEALLHSQKAEIVGEKFWATLQRMHSSRQPASEMWSEPPRIIEMCRGFCRRQSSFYSLFVGKPVGQPPGRRRPQPAHLPAFPDPWRPELEI